MSDELIIQPCIKVDKRLERSQRYWDIVLDIRQRFKKNLLLEDKAVLKLKQVDKHTLLKRKMN